jgi:hypothetical protein
MTFRRVISLCVAALLLALRPLASHQEVARSQQPSEDDWWLPAWVERTPGSGLYGGFNLPAGESTLTLATVTWQELNPAEGVYDWSAIDRILAGPPFILRLYSSDVIHCPTWLASKYPDLAAQRFRWPDAPYPDMLGQTSAGDFYPMWHPGVEAEFRNLMLEFRARNIAADPKMKGWYVPGGWQWNEWSLKWVPEMASQGVTPAAFLAWFDRLMSDYVSATNGHPGKLIYTGGAGPEWVEWTGDTASHAAWESAINEPPGGNAMSASALRLGAGARYGATEWFNYVTNAPGWGTTVTTIDGASYMATDDKHPFLADPTRFFGTENECWALCGMPAGTDDYYHVKMATLKALQLRMNWVFLGDYELAPGVFDYMLKTLGKRVYDSPDAWVALREAEDTEHGRPGSWVRNWERWLVQREIPSDGATVRTAPVTSPASEIGTSYEARRTDHAGGSDYIYFGVDDRFLAGGSTEVIVHVTYLDDNHAEWTLQYDAADGPIDKATESVTNVGDGAWKTRAFTIPDGGFANRQAGGMDFRLYNGGLEDLTVRFVRIIKTVDPTLIQPAYRSASSPVAR